MGVRSRTRALLDPPLLSRPFSLAFFLLSLVSRLFSPLSLVSCLFSAISRLSSLVSRLSSLLSLSSLRVRVTTRGLTLLRNMGLTTSTLGELPPVLASYTLA